VDELRRLDSCNIYPHLPFAFDSTSPLSPTMSATHVPREIQVLSDDELTLHHYAANVENYLKAYRASPVGNDESLKVPLQNALISCLVFLYFCDLPSKEAHIC
jgi:hypothetical protein